MSIEVGSRRGWDSDEYYSDDDEMPRKHHHHPKTKARPFGQKFAGGGDAKPLEPISMRRPGGGNHGGLKLDHAPLDVDAKVEFLKDKLRSLESKMETEKPTPLGAKAGSGEHPVDIGAKVDFLKDKLRSLEARVDAPTPLGAKAASMDHVSDIGTKVDFLKEKLRSVEARVESPAHLLRAIEAKMASADQLHSVESKVEFLKDKVHSLEARIESPAHLLRAIEDKMPRGDSEAHIGARHTEKIDFLRDKVRSIEAALKTQADISSRMVDSEAHGKIEFLKEKVRGIEDQFKPIASKLALGDMKAVSSPLGRVSSSSHSSMSHDDVMHSVRQLGSKYEQLKLRLQTIQAEPPAPVGARANSSSADADILAKLDFLKEKVRALESTANTANVGSKAPAASDDPWA